MSYIEPSEWDESLEELEKYEESEGEIVLRSERESMWDSINRGISYQHLELNNII